LLPRIATAAWIAGSSPAMTKGGEDSGFSLS
jgi:hypothetical protein